MIAARCRSDSPFGSPALMFRGKSATNGEGQTGGIPFNHLGVAAEEQNRTDKEAEDGGKDADN